jgi:predicted RNase H-like HicB family nuclease
MKPYIVIVHKDEHSAYGMSFPDAPGCFSAADEIDDIFAMATEALELWAEGMRKDGSDIPNPHLLSELKADIRWVEDFADAAFIFVIDPPSSRPIKRLDAMDDAQ